MFQKLYQYIAGANSENENIDMTTPVSTKWDNIGIHEECFYLNKEHQLNPPKPTSPDVYIVTRPAMTIYTRFVYTTQQFLLILPEAMMGITSWLTPYDSFIIRSDSIVMKLFNLSNFFHKIQKLVKVILQINF